MKNGLVVVDKPAGLTSHDVVAKLRKALNTRRIGHSGTLDPGATGVLLVGVGPFTRFLRYLTELEKEYEFEIVFGTTTSTLDSDGEIVEKFDMSFDTEQVRAAAKKLTGNISQIPPMVSAVHVDGKRLHEYAREGIEVERKARPVHVREFVVETTDDPLIYKARASCSSGTYVRVLGADLGELLGGGAHIQSLRRTRIGSFPVSEAKDLAEIEEQGEAALLNPVQALRDYETIDVDSHIALELRQGKRIALSAAAECVVATVNGAEIVGVLEKNNDKYKPQTVMSYAPEKS